MSRFSNMRISKGGRLLVDEWIYDKKKREGHTDKDIDITDYAIFHFNKECELEPDVVLEDVLLLIENINEYQTLSPLLTSGPWLKDMVDEGLIGEPSGNSSITNIVLGWYPSIEDDYFHEGQSLYSSYVHVHGIAESDKETYSLSFVPMYNLKKCSIILNRGFVIHNECAQAVKEHQNLMQETYGDKFAGEYAPTVLHTNKDFTLLDILYGLFWELSFHGGPKNRDAKLAELDETIRKIKTGEEKTLPWEEVRDRLKGEIE